ncbi:competence protein ComEA [Nicoletella semolina]|uniref:Competence protein ComEA n=1 Tax=Nicoletella semolina TaxID=271160 RepID=A0A4R2N4T2_9PAST|nr:helix-hairpin-helix domain-containing protein [Nicoletella semolina]MDH2924570.1 transporter [Nicoletella semolina]TCP15793.1 competence protein ComEA [Nicoletella semolina]
MKKFTRAVLCTFIGLFSAFSFVQPSLATEQVSVQSRVAEQKREEVTNTILAANSVNINLASAAEIQDKLIGIGAKKAQAIVEYREKYGKFQSLEQLTEVSGIGKATLQKNQDRIVLE